jgi:predicted nucleic acid-binding protein
MIKRVFIDTDVILDVALAREPFLEASRIVLALLENNIAIGYMSSNGVANLYYILRKSGGDENARLFITKLIQYITIISIDHSDIVNGLKSKIPDFEDALQQYSASRNQCDCIVTRNLNDYKNSSIKVYSPIEFLNLYKEKL